MLLRNAIAVIPAVVLASCQYVPGTEQNAIYKARKAVEYGLTDPTSPLFRNERVVQLDREKKAVCGEVNAKNRMGAYVGFTPFAYDIATGKAVLRPVDMVTNEDAMAILTFPEYCTNLSKYRLTHPV